MITSLRLQNFRTYNDESFEFDNGVTIIVGPNTSGKTNLLESIYVVLYGKSFRVKDADLIMHKKEWGRIDAEFTNSVRTIKLKQTDNDLPEKELIIDGKSYKRAPASARLPVVLFEPNHLQLFHQGPESRRDYIDELAEKLNPSYAKTKSHYKRVLAQRNRLLKQRPNDISQQIFVWNIRLSELGGRIVEVRTETLRMINEILPTLYGQLANSAKKATMHYMSQLPAAQYSSGLLHNLESNLSTEMERGFTLYGPHRDDLMVNINGHNVQETASRGEIRSVLLALKIIELQLVEAASDTKPILLLDDVFSELDGARRQALTETIADHQTFITTTDADIVVQHFLNRCTIIPLGTKVST